MAALEADRRLERNRYEHQDLDGEVTKSGHAAPSYSISISSEVSFAEYDDIFMTPITEIVNSKNFLG